MSEYTIVGIIGILFLILMLFSRMAVASVMAFVGFIGYSYLTNLQVGLRLLSTDIFSVFSSYGLTLIPLFVFMGYIAFYSGVSSSLYDVAYKLIGSVQGGLAMATVMACAAFGAVCDSATATTATMGTIGLPEMKRYNYGAELSTGCVASGGGLGSLMPPSVVLIIYGILTEQSIGALFIAGVLPAILMTLLFMAAIRIYCIFKPEQGPKGEKFTVKEMILSLRELWETLAVFLFVMGGTGYPYGHYHTSCSYGCLYYKGNCQRCSSHDYFQRIFSIPSGFDCWYGTDDCLPWNRYLSSEFIKLICSLSFLYAF